MKAMFTPGEWQAFVGYDAKTISVVKKRRNRLGRMVEIIGWMGFDGSHIRSKKEQIANAHLISAAPDLYKALDECLREHGGYTIKGKCEQRARAALAKARPSDSGTGKE